MDLSGCNLSLLTFSLWLPFFAFILLWRRQYFTKQTPGSVTKIWKQSWWFWILQFALKQKIMKQTQSHTRLRFVLQLKPEAELFMPFCINAHNIWTCTCCESNCTKMPQFQSRHRWRSFADWTLYKRLVWVNSHLQFEAVVVIPEW